MDRATLIAAVRDDLCGLKELLEEMEEDLAKVEKGRKAPGVRIRKNCQEMKHFLANIRTNVLDINKIPVE